MGLVPAGKQAPAEAAGLRAPVGRDPLEPTMLEHHARAGAVGGEGDLHLRALAVGEGQLHAGLPGADAAELDAGVVVALGEQATADTRLEPDGPGASGRGALVHDVPRADLLG